MCRCDKVLTAAVLKKSNCGLSSRLASSSVQGRELKCKPLLTIFSNATKVTLAVSSTKRQPKRNHLHDLLNVCKLGFIQTNFYWSWLVVNTTKDIFVDGNESYGRNGKMAVKGKLFVRNCAIEGTTSFSVLIAIICNFHIFTLPLATTNDAIDDKTEGVPLGQLSHET